MNKSPLGDGQNDSILYSSYVLPLSIFLILMLLLQAAGMSIAWDHPSAAWWQRSPEMLIYPLQTLICGAYLWHTRRNVEWDWTWKGSLLAIPCAIIGIAFWLTPYIFGWIDASEGFDPARIFGKDSAACYLQYSLRFARAVLIVPLVEELFWRGFLMRWCINPNEAQKVPLGTHSWKAYFITTGAFMLIHNPQDYAGAFIFGSIVYWLTVTTRRLTPSILMHAIANLIMGICAIALNIPGIW